MADNKTLPATGTGTANIVVATDEIGGVDYQRVKLALGADGTAADAPVGAGTEAGVLRVTVASDSSGVLSVDDNGASLTVDAPVGTPAFVRLSDGTAAIARLPVNIGGPGTIDSFGHLILADPANAIDIQFYRDTVANLVTVTTGTGGTAGATNGMATFACTTSASSFAKGVTGTSTFYSGGAEIYALFTAAFTGSGAGTSYQRIGLYDTNDGFFIGYAAGTFGVSVRKGGSDVQTPKASWNGDTLVAGATSQYTRGGTPEAIDLTKLNVWRIRFGWVGSAPVKFEVLSPDGDWVTVHTIRQPNNAAVPSINTADLPITCDVNGGNSGAALSILTNCWVAGSTTRQQKLNATIATSTLADLTRAVIAGETTAGGGGYVNVKVNPSGTLTADVTGSVRDLGSATNIASQVTVTNSSTAIVAARATRRAVVLLNLQTVAVYVDPTGGTATTSMFRLDPGASITLPVVTAVTGITSAAYTASGDAKVHIMDLF